MQVLRGRWLRLPVDAFMLLIKSPQLQVRRGWVDRVHCARMFTADKWIVQRKMGIVALKWNFVDVNAVL